MKRIGNIYHKICKMDNLREAHRKARKGKSFYREVQMVDNDEDFFLNKIRKSLLNQTFTTSQYTIKEIEDRGIDFLGYRCFGHYRLLRKRIAKNIKNKYKVIKKKGKVTAKDINSMMSYKGWLDYCDSYRFRNKYLRGAIC